MPAWGSIDIDGNLIGSDGHNWGVPVSEDAERWYARGGIGIWKQAGAEAAAAAAAAIPPPPDVMGFLAALFADPLVGGNVARKLNRDYSDGLRALEQGRWAAARQAILDAKNNLDITMFTLTAPMYDQIVVLLAQFKIPLA